MLMNRRHLLGAAGATLVSAAWPAGARAQDVRAGTAGVAGAVERWLELRHTHTGEQLAVAYRAATGYVSTAIDRLDWLLRDHRAQESHPIDRPLFDQLADLAAAAGVEPRYEIISGYRSPQTNDRLAAASGGVAKRSLHMQGRAIDVRLKGVSCARLRDLALVAGRGGVGYYRSSDFVHLDTGRVRAWAG
jgi:uncharacterized protein YcbK (DUF882 family)